MLHIRAVVRLLGMPDSLVGDRVARRSVEPGDARLITELYPALRRFAAVVAPWDDDPDDVLHAALISVLRSRSLADLDDAGAYLRRAIVNTVKSNHRRSMIGRRVLGRLAGSEAVTEQYPSDVAELQALSPLERAVIYLHDIEGLSFDEVAELVRIRPGNARVVASRARRRLRDELTEEELR